jgi:uncharacterized ferritin-like protein (DUF455 family)
MVRDFAERVLFGGTLADKLAPPVSLVDEVRGPALLTLPEAPGRPVGLRFDDPRPKAPSPKRADLLREDGRGRVLHGFANHELLALELMALMLLRFPDAPEGWRKGLVVTMQDEQRHLQLYLERMAVCGVEPGAVPVSSFFWDTLADAADPLAFTAAMGLGFEQANLDFASIWGRHFRQAGDLETAAVLAEVYADEVRHVRHGVAWYQRLSGEELEYESWARRLVFPMSPARARGSEVDREGRRRAGIPVGYTDALEVSGTSRGGPPTVFQFRAGVEDEVAGRAASAVSKRVQADLQHLPLLLAHTEDALIAEPASVSFLQGLREAGFTPCEVVPDRKALGDRVIGRLEPWGWSALAASELDAAAPEEGWSSWWGKDRVVPWQQAHLRSVRCSTVDQVRAALPEGPWLVKALRSASGMRRLRGEGPLTHEGKVAAWLAEDGAVVVQRWLERVIDLSVHGDVGVDGVVVRGIVRFETGSSGVFRGAFIGPWGHGLSPELRRFVHGPQGDVQARLEAVWTEVATALRADGYQGPLGVDAMVVRDGELALVPVVEANPRWTMGRIALSIRKRVCGRAQGWWRFLPVAGLSGGPQAWLDEHGRPLQFEGGKLLSGTVATNDPGTAKALWTVLELN